LKLRQKEAYTVLTAKSLGDKKMRQVVAVFLLSPGQQPPLFKLKSKSEKVPQID
jgi:hypothetical protein